MSSTGSKRPNTAVWTHGRPVRGRSGRLLLPEIDVAEADDVPDAARAWIEAARHEFSSVASFYCVGASLVALGAPSDLVDRTLEAADDEHRHSEICLAFAQRSGAGDVRIVTDVCELTRHRRRPDDLVDTATSALIDGVIAEGSAARRCKAAADHTPALAAALRRLATDEFRHADLAIDIVTWCISVRPWIESNLKRALDDVSDAAPRSATVENVLDEDRPEHGLCTDRDAQTAWTESVEVARRLVASVRSTVA